MKNRGLIVGIVIVLIAVVLIGGLTFYILATKTSIKLNNINNNPPSSNTQPSTNTNPPETNNTNTEISSTPKTYDVEIKDFAFSPSTLTIKKGDSVKWTNKDSVRHTATSDDGVFDSPLLSDGESFTFTFNEAGEFLYHCRPHPYMRARIIVA